MANVCLVVIFNHRYEENIDKLKEIYKGRFSDIKFLMPFYSGNDENVIPVFDSSYYFNAYVTQAYERLCSKSYKHYFFVADDLLLNPAINEDNYEAYFDIYNKSLISTPRDMISCGLPLRSYLNVWDSFNYVTSGCHWERELPTAKEACDQLETHGFSNIVQVNNEVFKNKSWRKENMLYAYRRPKVALKVMASKFELPYPIVCGFSDFYIIRGDKLKEFCFISGVFSAINLQVEMATPTAMLLTHSPDEIRLLERGKNVYHARDYQYLKTYSGILQELVEKWDKDCAFIHPIKLSQWR